MYVQQRVALEYNNGSAVNYNPVNLLEYLERIYSDARAADRARIELDSRRQRNGLRMTACIRFEDHLTGLRWDFDRQSSTAVIPKRDYAGAVAKWLRMERRLATVATRCGGQRRLKVAYPAPVRRHTGGNIRRTDANATGFKKKKSKTAGNNSAKAGSKDGCERDGLQKEEV
ncbi:hypothetical protein E4U17_003991 [Claviceps sp. LM77 group G4]|nr:hypothetical protein E4U17_003991 [Claviceps sp. LM77 group G4]KAG6080765.1 hypothetical protein E4U16_008157 [Claviceps sp. LM84 group G4]KAG6082169.1 hypothetical protein E4U33_005961 [Claviceps sp. LM78 group G4]